MTAPSPAVPGESEERVRPTIPGLPDGEAERLREIARLHGPVDVMGLLTGCAAHCSTGGGRLRWPCPTALLAMPVVCAVCGVNVGGAAEAGFIHVHPEGASA